MFISTQFEYDGINSDVMGVSLISVDNNLVEMPFGYKKSLRKEKIPFKNKHYFFGYDSEPLQLKITIGKLNDDDLEWTYDERIKLVQWFYQDGYKPFVSLDNPEVVYYCMPIDDSLRYDNRLMQGYVTMTLECNSPFASSPTYIDTYDYQINTNNILNIENKCNVFKNYSPEIQIEMTNDTSFTITNLTNSGQVFQFSGLNVGETIYINNEMKQIISSLPNTYRLGNFNKDWLQLVQGINQLQITGNVKVTIRCTYPISI